MDEVDRKILTELQRDGRLSSQALAERVNLSTTPCWRRVKRLEKDGVITGYVSTVDPRKVGLDVIAFANVSLEDHHPDSVGEFDRVVRECPNILEAHALSGQHDYLLKIICESIGAYDRLLSDTILQCRAVHTVSTGFVLRSTKSATELPM